MTEERAQEIMKKTRELWDAKGDTEHFDKLLKMLRDESVPYCQIFDEAEDRAVKQVYFEDAYVDNSVRREMREAARAAMIKVVEKRAKEHTKIVEQLQADYDKL